MSNNYELPSPLSYIARCGGNFYIMSRILLILLSLLSFVLTSCKKQTIEERIAQEAKLFTQKNCPKEIDKFTTLDSCSFDIVKRTYYYDYTVHGDLDVDSLYTQDLHDLFHTQLLADIKNSITLKNCKDAGLTFCYRYYSDKTGKLRMVQKLTKNEYK